MACRGLLCLTVLLQFSTFAQEPKPVALDEYDQFMSEHKRYVLGRSRLEPSDDFILRFTAITGDSELPEQELVGLEPGERALRELNHREKLVSYGSTVSAGWDIRYFSHTSRGAKGSSGSKVPEKDRVRLKERMAMLPDDGRRLPPADRKLLVVVRTENAETVRVYDRAQLPDVILELLHLGGGHIASWAPAIKSVSFIQADRNSSHFGAFALFPEGKRILSSAERGPLKLWDAATHELLKEANVLPDERVEGIVLSPDGSIAAIRGATDCFVFDTGTWKALQHMPGPAAPGISYCLRNIRFTAGGKTLLMQTGEPKVYAFDTQTWKPVETLPDLPENAWSNLCVQQGDLTFLGSKDHKLELWRSGKRYATLDESAVPTCAAFSPDQSKIVVSTSLTEGRGERIRVWTTAKEELLWELIAYEVGPPERVEALTWSPDGQYVLGAVRPGGLFDTRYVCVWSMKSGRQRGTLKVNDALPSPNGMKSLGPVNGMGWLDNGRTLVAGDRWGAIHFWDFEAASREIARFEASLESTTER